MVHRPKELRGLDIKNLAKFGRALQQRWLWQHWNAGNKPWQGPLLPVNKDDHTFFATNARIEVGNGKSTLFWYDTWMRDKPLKGKLPNLFQVARYKNRTVVKEVEANNWIRSVRNITTTEQIQEYVILWNSMRDIHMTDDRTK